MKIVFKFLTFYEAICLSKFHNILFRLSSIIACLRRIHKVKSFIAMNKKRDTRLVSSSAIRAGGPALLDGWTLRATAVGYSNLKLPGTFQYRTGIPLTREHRIGAVATCAWIRAIAGARVDHAHVNHTRAFRRQEESCAACAKEKKVLLT